MSVWPERRSVVAALIAATLAYSRFFATSPTDAQLIDGIPFAKKIAQHSTPLTLVGGGTRYKYNVVPVYAVGIYVDAARMAAALKPFIQLPAPALLRKTAFFDAAAAATVAKAVVLGFHRSVSASAVVDALKDALASKVSKGALVKFRDGLGSTLGDRIVKGTELTLACRGSTLRISCSGKSASLSDKTICPALFGVYLGKSPVSPAAKEAFARGFAAMQ